MITDDHGRERERHKVPYGATLTCHWTATQIKAGTVLATWDPHTRPIITEYAGTVKFENVEEGVDGGQADRRSDRVCPRWW